MALSHTDTKILNKKSPLSKMERGLFKNRVLYIISPLQNQRQ